MKLREWSWQKKLAMGLFAVFLCLGFGELAARLMGLGDPPLSLADDTVEYRFQPGQYRRFGNNVSYNSFSMRSPDIAPEKTDPSEYRVLVLGDSVINGGVLTDDSDLGTARLQERLAARLERPTWVGNVSADSWGPANQAAYIDKFGSFGADAVIMVLSGHDGSDAPTFKPVVGRRWIPNSKPVSALFEGIERYTPLGRLFVPKVESTRPVLEPTLDERRHISAEAIAKVSAVAAAEGLRFGILLFWGRYELEEGADKDQHVIRNAAARLGVPLRDMEEPLRANKDRVYREGDRIHPNEQGQELIAQELERLLEQLNAVPTSKER